MSRAPDGGAARGGGAARFARWAALAAFLACEIFLLGLAGWQWQRYQQALVREAAAHNPRPPREIAAIADLADAAPQERVIVRGRFLPQPTQYIWTPSPPGWIWAGLFQLEHGGAAHGGAVLVQRGFASAAVFDPPRITKTHARAGSDTMTLTARAQRLPASGRFVPPGDGRIWYGATQAELARVFPEALASRILVAERAHGLAEDGLALAPPPRGFAGLPPSRHLGYALTWAVLALALAAVGAIFVRERRHAPRRKVPAP